jgi:2,3,4,5-tetrahydropyridine-2-carboxylate N-succinyltransferase
MEEMREIIEKAWEDRELLKENATRDAIREAINLIDDGKLRCAEPGNDGWQINEWVKKAVVLYFPIQKMETHEV